MSRFQFLGVNDDRDFCECCGKQELKRVVWIEDLETGEVKHYGTTCATNPAKAFGVKVNKAIRNASANHDRWSREAAMQAWWMIRRFRPSLRLSLHMPDAVPVELMAELDMLKAAYYAHWHGATQAIRNDGAERMWRWEQERKMERLIYA